MCRPPVQARTTATITSALAVVQTTAIAIQQISCESVLEVVNLCTSSTTTGDGTEVCGTALRHTNRWHCAMRHGRALAPPPQLVRIPLEWHT